MENNSELKLLAARNQMLDTLFKISSTFNGLLEQDEILRQFSMYLMGQFAIKNFALYIFDHEKNKYTLLKKENIEIIPENIFVEDIILDSSGINRVGENQKLKMIFSDSNIEFVIELTDNKGLLVMGARMLKKEFTELDFNFMVSITDLAMLAVENSRLILEEQEKKLIEQELNTALKIQQGLLPKNNPELYGYEIVGASKSYKFVGGDYYDFIKIDENRYLIVIADVCGKNISAALVMSNLQSALKSQLFFITDLEQIIAHLNTIIYENTEADIFVTFFFGILDSTTNEFTYINGGHNPPMLYKSNNKEMLSLSEGGVIVGIFNPLPFEYSKATVTLEKEDVLVLYTDGITESVNSLGIMLGESWLENFIRDNSHLPANLLLEKIISAVEEYQVEQHDDITLVVIKKK